MSKNGGYQILELKGNFKTASSYSVDFPIDVYELIEATTKPILITGVEVNDVDVKDFFASFVVSGSVFVAKTGNLTITVTNNTTKTTVTVVPY